MQRVERELRMLRDKMAREARSDGPLRMSSTKLSPEEVLEFGKLFSSANFAKHEVDRLRFCDPAQTH